MKIEPVKINKKQFESVCLDIISDPNYHKEKYMQIAKDKIQTHYLKLSLQRIARNYIPHKVRGTKISFPAEIVIEIAKRMNLYVTDIVIFK